MESGNGFIDYYALLQVNPTCDSKILEKAYHHFAHIYHPDHSDTADVDQFQRVIEAYKVLRNSESRARYDKLYHAHKGNGSSPLSPGLDNRIDEDAALLDAEMHQKLLLTLYKRRREHADDPGMIVFYAQEALGCSEESFNFHVWYLRSKGLIEQTGDGSLAITVEGVDHVIATSRAAEAQKLLTAEAQDDIAAERAAEEKG